MRLGVLNVLGAAPDEATSAAARAAYLSAPAAEIRTPPITGDVA